MSTKKPILQQAAEQDKLLQSGGSVTEQNLRTGQEQFSFLTLPSSMRDKKPN